MLVTDNLSRIMSKHHCNIKEAHKISRENKIKSLMEKHNCTYTEAKSILKQKDNQEAINNEKDLAQLLRSWGLSARRIPRSGALKKAPKRRTGEPKKPADVRLILEHPIIIECKLRSDCHSVYDKVCYESYGYLIHHQSTKNSQENEQFYVIPKDTFKEFIVDKKPPIIKEWGKNSVKWYYDLFRETEEKTREIDIVTLRQRYKKHVFIVRQKTMDFLRQRCNSSETLN